MGAKDLISEDSNQFGPGTDLVIALMAFLMVMVVISIYLYGYEKKRFDEEVRKRQQIEAIAQGEKQRLEAQLNGSNFKLASVYFSAGTFKLNPYTDLVDEAQTNESVSLIVREYQSIETQYPFIFVIGHANQVDDPRAADQSDRERLQRNWRYAGERAGVIAKLIQDLLDDMHKQRIVVVSAGELDMKQPDSPYSSENAWVEVVFGKDWKIPARETIGAPSLVR